MVNLNYPDTMSCKMRRSKNIFDKRDVPNKMVLGCMNPSLYPLLNLTVYLKVAGQMSTFECNTTNFVYRNPNDRARVIQTMIMNLIKRGNFKEIMPRKQEPLENEKGHQLTRPGVANLGTMSIVEKMSSNKRYCRYIYRPWPTFPRCTYRHNTFRTHWALQIRCEERYRTHVTNEFNINFCTHNYSKTKNRCS